MAAAYATGTATSPNDLLQKLVAWLVTQAWTQNMSQALGSSWRAHLVKNGQYLNLRSSMNEQNTWATQYAANGYGIGFYLGDGYDGGVAWNLQSGGPLSSGTSNRIGAGMYLPAADISAYHFFDDGNDHITVVIERTFGNCAHMGWGPSLVKTGYTSDHWYFYGSSPSYYNVYLQPSYSWTGYNLTADAPMSHSFYYGGYSTTAYIRTDVAVFSERWISMSSAAGSGGYTGRQGRHALDVYGSMTLITEIPQIGGMQARGWQTAFSGALLLPLQCFIQSSLARWIPAGYPPTVFYCGGVGHSFESGDIYTVGGVNYMIFPGFAVLKAA